MSLYANGELDSVTGWKNANVVIPSGGQLYFGEDQDAVGGGFDPRQAYK